MPLVKLTDKLSVLPELVTGVFYNAAESKLYIYTAQGAFIWHVDYSESFCEVERLTDAVNAALAAQQPTTPKENRTE